MVFGRLGVLLFRIFKAKKLVKFITKKKQENTFRSYF